MEPSTKLLLVADDDDERSFLRALVGSFAASGCVVDQTGDRAVAADAALHGRYDAFLLGARAARAWDAVHRSIGTAKRDWEVTFDTVPDPIAILDTSYRLLRVNRAMAARLGSEPDDLIGRTCYECVHALPTPGPVCPHQRLLEDGQEHTVELFEPRLGGYFLVTASPLRDAEGRLKGSVHVARDITARKQVEDALEAANERLQEAVGERTRELEEKMRRLEETTTALRVMLRQRQEDERELERRVLSNFRKVIHPSLERLKRKHPDAVLLREVERLEGQIEKVTSAFSKAVSESLHELTPAEVQVAGMVRDGQTTKQIAASLAVSESTVKFHRMNLRKKLGLTRQKKNLRVTVTYKPQR